YGDSCNDASFDPLDYTRTNLYPGASDSQFYFVAQSYNASEPVSSTSIHKLYPDQPYPTSLNPETAQPDELTEDGYLKYFEYEMLIDNLLPTVPYWVNVTALDYGSPESGLDPLETSVTLGAKMAYPLSSWDDVQAGDLEVFVYPNPYRIDGEYRERGFEGRTEPNRPPDRTREIHFANLPPVCTIQIYTLDGDLVREIVHDDGTTHATWDMITRNTQMVVSGLYYWTVEAEGRDIQIGKLAVIM
ncbi:MAG: hypothetical protein U9R56_04950, partial [candidate division Zixibacteria bacterium]|nr:hypothetical protein [candidate division Zixibacteria bacterium]